MKSSDDRLIQLEIFIPDDRKVLLEGLEAWQRLGLLQDSQVKQICRKYLICKLPTRVEPAIAAKPQEPDFVVPVPRAQPARRRERAEVPAQPLPAPAPTWLSTRLQSLMAEISVIWLLLLGVFMVVVSSGVLAASQWRSVSTTGQYSILLGYTLAFWGASVWAGRKPNLTLTARMLQIATLLIIPVNFWMIDGLGVWQQPGGVAIALIAAVVLTILSGRLLAPLLPDSSYKPWLLLDGLALSWLHWGWQGANWPLAATYIGTVGTVAVLFLQDQARSQPIPESSPASGDLGGSRSTATNATDTNLPKANLLGLTVIAIAACLLIVRAVWVAQVPVSQLGLALGACGWLLCWLPRDRPITAPWTQVGTLLLITGWLVGLNHAPPWQAIAVSGLAMWLLSDRLQRSPQILTLTALFGVGLQAYWLLWWLVPAASRAAILASLSQLDGTQGMPIAFVGVGLLPYLGLTLAGAVYLRRSRRRDLADWSETLALFLGACLTLLSLVNPAMRSLNLIVSTGALVVVMRQRDPVPASLIYLTHATGLAAIAASIDWIWPDLLPSTWAIVLLVGMVLEWSLTHILEQPAWKESSWFAGLLLATLSYILWWLAWRETSQSAAVLWLLTPIALTLLATRRRFSERQLASWLSVGAVVLVQPLTLGWDSSRLISLGVATGLLFVNTQQLQRVGVAILTVGFGLGFTAAAIWQSFGNSLTIAWSINLSAIALLILWGLRDWSRRQTDNSLASLYTQALDVWAVVLVGVNLIFLTAYNAAIFNGAEPQGEGFISAIAITLVAFSYRIWQQPTNLGFYGFAWGVELLVSRLLMLPTPDAVPNLGERWAIANLALGLATQLVGDLWVRRRSQPYMASWHGVPLLYAGLGCLGGHLTFTATTGWYTLATTAVAVGVGRRQSEFRPFTYFSVLGVSVAAYELLIYQLLQASGGQAGDGIVILGALSAGLAIAWRFSSRWVGPYLRLLPAELNAIAHLHWVISSSLLLFAVFFPLSNLGEPMLLGIAAILALYALVEGRHSTAWTYTGIIMAGLAFTYGASLVLPTSVLLAWGAAIASGLAVGIDRLPWRRWGWPVEPWARTAVILPGLVVILTLSQATLLSLLITAIAYAWFARLHEQVRLSYVSVGLADWAIARHLDQQGWQNPLWYGVLVGGSLLYVIQVDPGLETSDQRETRHGLRCLAVGLVCLIAIYQSETQIWAALLTLILSIGLILTGLALRTRAFLYIGTLTFVIQILRQLWLLIANYSLLLWAIGIVLGLVFIWIAATFEARRSQVSALVDYWLATLAEWE